MASGSLAAFVRLSWRRFWPGVVLAIAALAVVAVRVLVNRLLREPPNYLQIEDVL